MISSVEWVPRGVADPNPKQYELSAAEQELLLLNQAGYQEEEDDVLLDEQEEQAQETITTTKTVTLPKVDPNSLPAELRMDEYSSDEEHENEVVKGMSIGTLLVKTDQEDNDDKEQVMEDQDWETDDSDNDMDSDDDLNDIPDTREFAPTDLEGLQAMGLSHVGAGAAMNLEEQDDDDDADDDDSDADDVRLSPDDAIIVVAKTEEDFASLEVHVYEEKTGNLFVHHDIALPSFPLCLAHGDVNSKGEAGNYCAVGTFSPGIEVWNLDILNPLEPSCILGGHDTSAADALMKLNMSRAASGKKLQKNAMLEQAQGGLVHGSHTDAIMSLSWNKVHRQVIASGSADTTVKIWDITKASDNPNAATFTHHKDKVQSVEWHPTEGTLLATGSYDKTVALVDARSADTKQCKRVKIVADVESIQWDPFHSQYLTVATEDGTISCWDVRKFESAVWSFVANEFGGVSDLTYNKLVPGMMATCAVDKTVTLWDTYSADGKFSPNAPPRPCGNKVMGVGKLFTMSFYPSSPWLLGCGGSGKELALWDMSSDDAVQTRFGNRIEGGSNGVILNEPGAQESVSKEEDFEAMMATKDAAIEKVKSNAAKSSKNKKKGKGKKKVHKKSR